MSKIDTTVSAITNGTYGMPNSIVGQIKTILLSDANVSIVSDTDPDNTTMRVLIYSVANQGHHFKIATTSATQIGFNLLALNGSTGLTTVVSKTVASGISYTVRLLYSAKAHFFMYGSTEDTSCVCLDCGDATNGWYLEGFGARCVVCNSSNSPMDLSLPQYGALGSSGQFVGIPARFSIDDRLTDYYYDYFYGTGTQVKTGFYTSGGYNYLSLVRSYILSDQVPS